MGVFTAVSPPQGLSWLKRGTSLNFVLLSWGSLFPLTDQYRGIHAWLSHSNGDNSEGYFIFKTSHRSAWASYWECTAARLFTLSNPAFFPSFHHELILRAFSDKLPACKSPPQKQLPKNSNLRYWQISNMICLKHNVVVGKKMRTFTVFPKPINTAIHSNTQGRDRGAALDSFLHHYYSFGYQSYWLSQIHFQILPLLSILTATFMAQASIISCLRRATAL